MTATVNLSYALHANILGWVKGSAMPTAPTSVKLALLTVAPNPDGTGVTEPSGSDGYARQTVTFGAIATAAGVSTIKNSAPVVFGAATADWATVTWAALFTQDGTMLAYGPLPASRTVVSGDQMSFGNNAIQLRLR